MGDTFLFQDYRRRKPGIDNRWKCLVNAAIGYAGGRFGGDGVKKTCATAKTAMQSAESVANSARGKTKHIARLAFGAAKKAYQEAYFNASMNTTGATLLVNSIAKPLSMIVNKALHKLF